MVFVLGESENQITLGGAFSLIPGYRVYATFTKFSSSCLVLQCLQRSALALISSAQAIHVLVSVIATPRSYV